MHAPTSVCKNLTLLRRKENEGNGKASQADLEEKYILGHRNSKFNSPGVGMGLT